jgi:hypothetical protein
MSQELPPRNWVALDENTTRLASNAEYREYLAIVFGIEDATIEEDEPSE